MLVKRKIGELRVSELRIELEKRNLDSKGLKSVLLQRLQKAITDEGGDIEQIELDISAGASPLTKKNSPRIKRTIEHTVGNESSVDLMPNAKKIEVNEEKSAFIDGGGDQQSKSIEEAVHTKEEINNEENNNDQAFQVKTTPFEANTLQSEYNNSSILNTEDKVTNDNGNEEFLVKDEVEEMATEPATLDQGSSNETELSTGAANVGDDNMDSVEVKITSSNEENAMDSDSKFQDVDTVDAEEATKAEDGDIALEDDVLDMLDYDIEMPDHSQTENDDDIAIHLDIGDKENEHEAHDVTKASDESGNKDNKVSSERNLKDSGSIERPLKNLWISGLSSSTRASELKSAFSRYGKVVGAKVVANAKSPGSKCYGFVAMATPAAAKKCVIHLHKTELHGRLITVEYIKHDPSTRRPSRGKNIRDESDDKTSQSSQATVTKEAPSLRRNSNDGNKDIADHSELKRSASDSAKSRIGEKRVHRSPPSERTRGLRRPSERREPSDEPHKKRVRTLAERKVMLDKKGGMSLRVNVRSSQGSGRDVVRRVSHSPIRTARPRIEERPRRIESRPLEHPRPRERELIRPRDARENISRRRGPPEPVRPARSMALQASIERDRMLLRKEREERNFLRMEREKLERERRQLERDRIERERLEHERIKLEQERKRELEKIEREKQEMKRLQEINRFEQSQRQRALKRMYDGRPLDDRIENKRVDRDDRRRYDGESRDRPGAPPVDMFFRENESGFRSRPSGPPGRIEPRPEKMNFHDVDRRGIGPNDTDARYGGHPSAGGRRVEKYERPSGKPNMDYDRRNHDEMGGGGNSMPFRHHEKDLSDDRKVVSRDRGRPTGGSFRRDGISLSKKDSNPPIRGAPTGGRPRADRDLREEIRQGPMSGNRKGSPHMRHRDEPQSRNPPRNSSDSQKYPDRNHPVSSIHGNPPIQSGPPSGKPIPTTGKGGINYQASSSWPSWQHSERGDSSPMWHGPNNLPSGGAPVGRLIPPMAMPFPMSSVNNPPPIGGDNAMSHGMPGSFPPSRMDNFKQMRRF